MLIWDTGASFCLTSFCQDFIDYVQVEIPVKDVTKVNTVIGVGTAIFKFANDWNEIIYLPCIAYHLPTTDVRLFSPQTYHQMHGGKSTSNGNTVTMSLPRHRIVIPIEKHGCNLVVVSVSAKEKKEIGFHFKTLMLLSGLNELDVFGTIPLEPRLSFETQPDTMELEYFHYSRVCCQSVASDENQNLSGPQKELLLWHRKLGTSMYCIQEMMKRDDLSASYQAKVCINSKL